MMSTLTIHCQRECEMVRKRTGHLPSYAETKEMKSLTLHTQGCSIGLVIGTDLPLLSNFKAFSYTGPHYNTFIELTTTSFPDPSVICRQLSLSHVCFPV